LEKLRIAVATNEKNGLGDIVSNVFGRAKTFTIVDAEDDNITDVRVRKITNEGKMKCIVSLTFNNLFVVHDIKVIEGHNGLFIAMPSRKVGEGNFRDIAHPINAEMRQVLEDSVLKAYNEAVAQLEVAAE